MRLCAGDPLCADHLPEQAGLDVHGATCHACLFAPETSCEKGNRYLDRCLLVETLSHADLAFFGDWQSLPDAAPAEPAAAPALELPSGPSLPAFEVNSLLDDNPVPIGARPSSSTEPNLFWLQIPDDSLNKIVQPNTWCLFRWLTPDDDLPQDDTLCVVRAEDRPVVRRFFWSERQDESNQVVGTRVLLRPRSTNADHRTLVVEVS